MPLLVIVSLLWAFSFGLIKGRLAGLDSAFISVARLGLALLVFLPFFRPRGLAPRLAATLAGIGAVQFGLMYLAYNESYRYLPAHEVSLFTLTTPLFVTLLADALDRSFRPRALAAALLAVVGSAIAIFKGAKPEGTPNGFLLVQFANAAFAIGQVAYRNLRRRHTALVDSEVFALPYAGAFALTLLVLIAKGAWPAALPSSGQIWTLVYLGVAASGLGFFLWNLGVTRVSASTAAVMNNAKIPLGIVVALAFFGESADLPRLGTSLLLLGAAVWLAGDARD